MNECGLSIFHRSFSIANQLHLPNSAKAVAVSIWYYQTIERNPNTHNGTIALQIKNGKKPIGLFVFASHLSMPFGCSLEKAINHFDGIIYKKNLEQISDKITSSNKLTNERCNINRIPMNAFINRRIDYSHTVPKLLNNKASMNYEIFGFFMLVNKHPQSRLLLIIFSEKKDGNQIHWT